MINFRIKKIILLVSVVFCSQSMIGQVVFQTDTLKMPDTISNIWIERISGDSLSSGFIIVIRNEVKTHKHLYHSEHISVLEGTGIMKLGKKSFELKPGVVVFIPKGVIHWVKTTSKIPLKVLSVQSPYFDGKDRVIVE
ncbi:MAG: cupin domain-containing protein [Bacteroidota bacterium]|nr:cupin domain-containing protein [Bacteroidota bacterium]